MGSKFFFRKIISIFFLTLSLKSENLSVVVVHAFARYFAKHKIKKKKKKKHGTWKDTQIEYTKIRLDKFEQFLTANNDKRQAGLSPKEI